MTLDEYDKIFRSLGRSLYWITISGGEPFLRNDISDIYQSAVVNCNPQIITIATNGLLSSMIPGEVEKFARFSQKTKIIINLSIDGIDEDHDLIRNARYGYKKVIETFKELKKLDLPNLTVGIHTVISKFNVQGFKNTYRDLIRMKPDSYITEIAEERVELDTVGCDITPDLEEYSKAVDFLIAQIKDEHYKGVSAITKAYRLYYYALVKRILKEERQVLPCYAGYLSAQIAPDGEVWACCTKAESMGNLRDAGYDFRKVWFSKKANEIRSPIRTQQCFCPLANASYTNMLVSYRAMVSVLKNMLANKYLKKKRNQT